MTRALTLLALLAACASPEPSSPADPASGDETVAEPVREVAAPAPVTHTLSFTGSIELQPEDLFSPPSGTVHLHVFTLDGEPFDVLACYGEPDYCTVLELHSTDDPARWTAHVADSVSASAPVDLTFELQDRGRWLDAQRVLLRVLLTEDEEAGSTTLVRSENASPPAGLRERLRAHRRLRSAFETIATDFHRASLEERRLPATLPAPLPAPPCAPQWVSDADSVAWLGLDTPVVLSWAYGIEAEGDTLRLVARRDPACDGTLETITLEVGVDEYGDLELRP